MVDRDQPQIFRIAHEPIALELLEGVRDHACLHELAVLEALGAVRADRAVDHKAALDAVPLECDVVVQHVVNRGAAVEQHVWEDFFEPVVEQRLFPLLPLYSRELDVGRRARELARVLSVVRERPGSEPAARWRAGGRCYLVLVAFGLSRHRVLPFGRVFTTLYRKPLLSMLVGRPFYEGGQVGHVTWLPDPLRKWVRQPGCVTQCTFFSVRYDFR